MTFHSMLRLDRPPWILPPTTWTRFSRSTLAVLAIVSTLIGFPTTALSETWTNLTGTKSVEGKMIGRWDDTVILVLNDGRRVSVDLDDLRAESRIQADEISERLAQQRARRVQELQAQAAAASAPAPDPLPQPPAAPEYQKPTAGMSAQETIATLQEQAQAGHLIVLLDLLPPSYQNDVEALVQQAIGKVDPAAWNAITGSLYDIGDLIVTRQRWVLSHPRLKALPPEGKEFVQNVILPYAGLLREGLDPEAMQIQSLKEKPFRQWLADRNAAIAPYLVQLNQQMEQQFAGATQAMPELEMTVVSEDEQSPTVQITQGEISIPFKLSRVEGFWVPEMLAQGWEEGVKKAKAALAEVPDGSIGSSGIASIVSTALEPALNSLKQAESAAEFHAAMEQLMASAAPVASMASSMMPSGVAPGNRGSSSYGSSAYGSSGYPGDGSSGSGPGYPGGGSSGSGPGYPGGGSSGSGPGYPGGGSSGSGPGYPGGGSSGSGPGYPGDGSSGSGPGYPGGGGSG